MSRNGTAFALEAAVDLAHGLDLGRGRQPITPPPSMPSLARDEYAFAEFSRAAGAVLRYERFRGADIAYSTPGGFALGDANFVAVFALMSALQRSHSRRKAASLAAPQWREHSLSTVVVTTQRLWCLAGGEWTNFDYDTIIGFDLRDRALQLEFPAAHPLRLTGDWAPWIAVAVAYSAFGRDRARNLALPRSQYAARRPVHQGSVVQSGHRSGRR